LQDTQLSEGLRRNPSKSLRGRIPYLDLDELTRTGIAVEVHRLVVPRPPAQPRLVGPAGPFDQHLHLTPDEALGALRRAALDQLDEPFHPLHLHRVRHLTLHLGGLGLAPWREDE